jgi:hypothetical protein
MPRPTPQVVIDARPGGPHGPLAHERVLGRSVLAHLLDQALALSATPVAVHARLDEHRRLQDLLGDRPPERVVFRTGPPPEGSAILRADRLYDASRLRRALRRGHDPEAAAIWRLDHPQGLFGAEDELVRRQSYQPLGRYWALVPARGLARALCPTRVRPNALTLASGLLVLGAAAVVAWLPAGLPARAATAVALALALVLDTADGHLARLQGTASEFGRWLDAGLDELGDMALHAAVAWAAFLRDAHPAWLLLGMSYGMGKYLFMFGNGAWEQGAAPRSDLSQDPARRPVPAGPLASFVRLAGHADVRWHVWILLAFFGRLDVALVAYSAYYPARAFARAVRKAVGHG